MTAWRIRWSARALRDLDRLEDEDARRIVRKLDAAALAPHRFFTRLVGEDDYKLRVGDFRILVLLSHDERTILVETVDHRSRVYDR